jgi:hypothetical protein
MVPSILLDSADPAWRIVRHDAEHPGLTRLEVIGSPRWEDVVEASITYNRAGPSRLTLWDYRRGSLPDLNTFQAGDGARRSAEQYVDLPERRVAVVTATDRDFGITRMIHAYTQGLIEDRHWSSAGRPFRDYEAAVSWLLSDDP